MTQLVNEVAYRRITHDFTSDQAEVNDRLVEAQTEIEQYLERTLSYGEYTETAAVWDGNLVYPSVTPVDGATSGYLDSSTLRLDGSSMVDFGAYAGGQRTATISYSAGFTATTLPTPIKRAIAQLAYSRRITSSPVEFDTDGLRALSFGDLSMTFADGGAGTDNWPAGLEDSLAAYVRREVTPS